MLRNFVTVGLLAAVCYWYWSGPYQARVHPNYQQRLEANDEAMKLCIRTANYKTGATGEGGEDPETACAAKHGVYFDAGHWHSYNDSRPE